MPQWTNWSGSLQFTPRALARPRSEAELCALLARAQREGRRVRVVGAGHSSWPLVRTQDLLLSLERLRGVVNADPHAREATLWAGTSLHEAGALLHREGLALENLGDVDTQSVAGALLTGTHGSGLRLRNLASNLIGARLCTTRGELRALTHDTDAELLRALRVSLGALGVLSAVRLRLVPSEQLRRRDYCANLDDCLTHLKDLAERHRNFDFYWYPRRDDVKLRTLNRAEEPTILLPYARLVHEELGFNHQVIARERTLKFEEMEYFVPLEAGVTCFQAVRRRMLAQHRQ
jgi:FAD/FMN-containing dehydrogenase